MIHEGKKYQLVYADPPWHFATWSKKGAGRSAEQHYDTHTLQELADMKISHITENDAILLMWATCPCLKQAIKLGSAWGFTYKTVAFVWVKENKGNSSLFMGMGYYTRANAEIVLLFTKGKPLKRLAHDISQVLIAPRQRHSEKPDEIRLRIERLFGDVARIELFARDRPGDLFNTNRFDGWDVYGNEVTGSIQLPD